MAPKPEIPSDVRALIDRSPTKSGDLRACVESDLNVQGGFGKTWVCLDEQWLYVVSQEEIISKYPLSELTELKCESFVGSSAIIGKIADQNQVICRGSTARSGDLNQFSRLVTALIKDDPDYEPPEARKDDRCPSCGRHYPDPNRPVCPHCLDKKSLFLRVLRLTTKYKATIVLIVVIMFASSLVGLIAPYLQGKILVDEVLTAGGKYEGKLAQVVLLIFSSSLVSLLLSIAHGRINSYITAEIVYDLKTMIFSAMQKLSLNFYSKRQTGALMNRVNSDAMDLQYFFHDGLPYFIVNSVQLIGVITVLLFMDWRLTLLILIPVPVILVFIKKVLPHLWRLYSKRFRANAALNSVVNDSLTGIRVVKAFGKEEEEIDRFGNRNTRVYDVAMNLGGLGAVLWPLLSYITQFGSIIVWGVGGWFITKGEMSLGTMMTFIGYLWRVYGPIHSLTQIADWWSSCMNSAQRIFEIIDSTDYLPLPDDPVRLPDIKGEVVAKNLEFGYEEAKPVLSEINFMVQPGEMIGFVGHSGAGKSTMINLISRMYDVTAGIITIDGVDIRKIAKEDLDRQIGMVLQETFLFQGTLMDNIAYARPDATPEEIIKVAKVANAHDFITRLPDGYETVIGRKGHDLSGGERQRIAIARALLLDPKILILDEATASIDTETEKLIQEALEKLVQGRTTFAIAHRLPTLRRADRLFVFDKGKIVEVGNHHELMAQKGIYEKLFTTQQEAMETTVTIGG